MKKIAGKPAFLDVNDLMRAAAEGDRAADNVLDMIDDKEVDGNDSHRLAELYNATLVTE